MLIFLLLLSSSLKADDYEYKGKAPLNFTGSVEVLSSYISKNQQKTTWTKDNSNKQWNQTNEKKDDREAFDNLSFASAKLGVTLQKLHENSKSGVTVAMKVAPGSFKVDQASLFIKNYFVDPKLKLSLRFGCVTGVDEKLATKSTTAISKTNSVYSMVDYLYVPGVATSNSINTNTGKEMKVVVKVKKIFSKDKNILFGVSYCPKAPHKGEKSFAEVDKLNDVKNHIGVGLRFYSKLNDWKYKTSITFSSANRFKFDKAELNSIKGFNIGKCVMYKTFGFAMNFGINLNSKVKNYLQSFTDAEKGIRPTGGNISNGKGNGGYVISPTVSFVANSLSNTEFYLSYLYGNRKTEWQKDEKQIYAKSHIISFGAAVPIRNIVLGSNIQVMKFNNAAHQDETYINAVLKNEEKFTVSEKCDKWITSISLFLKVKVSHDFQSINGK